MDINQAVKLLIAWAAERGKDAIAGSTTCGVTNTFERSMHIEYDKYGLPRCAWINSVDQENSCHINIRRTPFKVSYGPKEFTRSLGVIETRKL